MNSGSTKSREAKGRPPAGVAGAGEHNVRLPSQVIRARIRAGAFNEPTGGQAPGFVQANLVVVPQVYAFDFLLFCQRNPKPCPLLEVVEAGSVTTTSTRRMVKS